MSSRSGQSRPRRGSSRPAVSGSSTFGGGLKGVRDCITPEDYFGVLEHWLALEGEAERARMALRRQIRSQRDVESSGETLVSLQMSDHKTGLAGRLLLDFVKPGGETLPMNRLKVGSPVVISDWSDASDEGVAGVVSRRKHNAIQVATEQWPAGSMFRIDLSPDETTRRRQMAAMAKAQTATARTGRLRDALLGFRPLRFDPLPDLRFLTRLNPPQQDAVRFAMSAQDVAILHGPPGTGKTTTIAEVIYQAVARGERVLACAPSNTAVDNLLERLVAIMPNVLRVGHPARVFESLRGHTLDELVDADPSTDIIREMRRELEDLMRAASKNSRGRDAHRRKGALYAEAGQLRGQIRSLERSVIRSVIDSSDVVCTTTTIDDELLYDQDFDLVVIDEACQCTQPSVWQAVLRADRLVLAGDHCQLPPTVLSDEAARAGMRESLMQSLVEREGDSIFRRLVVQYRMNETIMNFSSQQFYDGTLVADASVRSHRLCDLPDVIESDLTTQPIEFIDTAGAEFDEQLEPDGQSKLNPKEANLILRLIREFLDAGVQPEQIAVIAPYAAQARLLRSRLEMPEVEIDTVDGFQGREKEVVLLTMVRSNDKAEIGFLADTRRTNVALTRARRKMIMVGDSATLASNEFYASLLQYFEDAGAYQSVWQFGDV
ncbi:ATP-dependent RecD-like DNA helicase [Novipirellula galeiformis]|uniref:DNA helicase n=1 Tax=Novipirellula galeiformis TaxID=2528004 RepID=A0A5C6CFG4_9BACT|nr:AAA domain-containing protein [Novipirellula galeiformis]TWU23360.1 ATP-dependent RecD-like DNA helicase [Novipirellula galeiformis]